MAFLRKTLFIGGGFLILFALAGYVGILGPQIGQSYFGSYWWLDLPQDLGHLVAGVICLVFALFLSLSAQRWLMGVLGFLGVLLAIFSLFNSHILGANIEKPIETLIYFTLGDLAVWALTKDLRDESKRELEKIRAMTNFKTPNLI